MHPSELDDLVRLTLGGGTDICIRLVIEAENRGAAMTSPLRTWDDSPVRGKDARAGASF